MQNQLRQRLLSLFRLLAGTEVEIQREDGVTYAGILYVAILNHGSKVDLGLKSAQVKAGTPPADFVPRAFAQIHSKEWALIRSSNVNLGSQSSRVGAGTIMTDTEISGNHSDLFGRELQAANAWLSTPASSASGALEDSSSGAGSWNQFEANQKLFGVKSSYDENLYTTRLDKSKISIEKSKAVAKLAREIESQSSSNFHLNEERGKVSLDEGKDLDEEARYSSVIREDNTRSSGLKGPSPGAYAPPALRNKSETVKPKTASPTLSYKAAANRAIAQDQNQQSTATTSSPAPIESNVDTTPSAPTSAAVETESKDETKKLTKKVSTTKLNPKAKEFKLSASASSFTPSFTPKPSSTSQHAQYPVQHHVPAQRPMHPYGGTGYSGDHHYQQLQYYGNNNGQGYGGVGSPAMHGQYQQSPPPQYGYGQQYPPNPYHHPHQQNSYGEQPPLPR